MGLCTDELTTTARFHDCDILFLRFFTMLPLTAIFSHVASCDNSLLCSAILSIYIVCRHNGIVYSPHYFTHHFYNFICCHCSELFLALPYATIIFLVLSFTTNPMLPCAAFPSFPVLCTTSLCVLPSAITIFSSCCTTYQLFLSFINSFCRAVT